MEFLKYCSKELSRGKRITYLRKDNAGCKNLSRAGLDRVEKVREEAGIPSIVFQASNADSRDLNEEETQKRAGKLVNDLNKRRRREIGLRKTFISSKLPVRAGLDRSPPLKPPS